MRLTLLTLVVVTGCGADPSPQSMPDLLLRDVAVAPPNECMNGFTDGEETDLDCGGPTCTPCDTGKVCKGGRDCASGFCTNSVCDASSCMDGVKNGSESDQDCGGGTCGACDDGKMCQLGTDCKSGTCTNNVCKGALMCMAGTADCDGNAGNGCEVNTNTDAKNCGGCGKLCLMGRPCQNASCQSKFTFQLMQSIDGQVVRCSAVNSTGQFTECQDLTQSGMYLANGKDCGPLWTLDNANATDNIGLCASLTGVAKAESYFRCSPSAVRAVWRNHTWTTFMDPGLTQHIRCYY